MVSLVSILKKTEVRLSALCVAVGTLGLGSMALAQSDVAYKIGGKPTTLGEVYKEDQASFYDLEKKKYELIDQLARQKYLEYYWQNLAKESGKSVAEAQKDYEAKNLKVSEKEVAETLEKFKDHPSLAKLEKKDQEKEVRNFLQERGKRDLYDGIIEAGIKKGDLTIVYPEPVEPVYKVTVTDSDNVKYGPEPTDLKPVGCKAEDCAITVVEYSEFQCPFCSRVVPDTKKILADYKGKIRWIVRDFPLSFHDRAKPAAIAAHCAAEQGKFWAMYSTLFDNQRALADADLKSYADKVGVDKAKYEKCVANPAAVEATIEKNMQSGMQLGVSGTPAFFINGRRLSGAMPYSEFKRIIDDELSGNKKSH
jgi:protein-disulfide isomerase